MSVKLGIFNDILFGFLSPWRQENTNEAKFRNILENQVKTNKDNPVQFFIALSNSLKTWSIQLKADTFPDEVMIANLAKLQSLQSLQTDFSSLSLPDHYNKISEFYYYLIHNENTRILAAVAFNVTKSKNKAGAIYQVNSLLKSIIYYIVQVQDNNYSDNISIFVLDALRISLFRLYEEIKVLFIEYLGPDILSESEIINLVAPDFKINKNKENDISFKINQFTINRNNEIPLLVKEPAIISTPETQNNNKPQFTPRKFDFNDGYKGKLSYDDIINKDLFAIFETHLYKNDIIDLNYNFTNKHNYKKELAAIYHIIIQKKYFREKNYKHHGRFRNADYRQLLDHRYNVDTSQQFRKSIPAYIKSISDKYYWLDNLQSCH